MLKISCWSGIYSVIRVVYPLFFFIHFGFIINLFCYSPTLSLFVSLKEWADAKYPPWAHGPGYVVSRDIAKAVYKKHKKGQLKVKKIVTSVSPWNLRHVLSVMKRKPLSCVDLLLEHLNLPICMFDATDVQAGRRGNGHMDCRYAEGWSGSKIREGGEDL